MASCAKTPADLTEMAANGIGRPDCPLRRKAISLTEHHYHAVLASMVAPRLRQFWRASTIGEKALWCFHSLSMFGQRSMFYIFNYWARL